MAVTAPESPPGAEPPVDASRRVGLFRRPPRRLFHGVLVATALVVIWAYSYPGVFFLAVLPCIWIVAIAGIIWIVRGVTYARARRTGMHEGAAPWFFVAPLGALVLAALLFSNLPLRARWSTSESAFNDAVKDVHAHPSDWTGWHERRVGTYRITSVQIVDEGVIFYDNVGSFIDDAGFAYLPNGPSDSLANGNFENPQWFALGDHWYAWTASW